MLELKQFFHKLNLRDRRVTGRWGRRELPEDIWRVLEAPLSLLRGPRRRRLGESFNVRTVIRPKGPVVQLCSTPFSMCSRKPDPQVGLFVYAEICTPRGGASATFSALGAHATDIVESKVSSLAVNTLAPPCESSHSLEPWPTLRVVPNGL